MFLKMLSEQTGGALSIESREKSEHPDDHGTQVTATFCQTHIDCPPLGDVISTVVTLIQGHPDRDFLFSHTGEGGQATLDTRELRAVLEEVPLDSFEVLQWIQGALQEQYDTAGAT